MPPRYYGSVSLVKKWEQARADKAAIQREKAQLAKIHQTRLRLQKQLAAVDPILVAQVKNQRLLKRNNPDTWAPAVERDKMRRKERYENNKVMMRAKLEAELGPIQSPPPPDKLVCPFGIAIANWLQMTDAEKRRAAARPFIPVADTR